MQELLETYSGSQIAMFLVILALAIKGVIDFIDWAKKRTRKYFQKENKENKIHEDLSDEIECCKIQIQTINKKAEATDETLNNILEKINLLIDSDKDQIKTIITDKYHYFMEQKEIDDYSLDCLEKMFKHYTDEHGNSFIEDLMKQLKALPRKK